MRALAAILLLALLGNSEARFQWRLQLGRNLLQVTPLATQPAAATVPATTQPTVATTQPAAVTSQPAVATSQPAVATTQPAIAATQPAVATVQPTTVEQEQPATVPAQPAGATAALPATYQNGAADTTEPAAAEAVGPAASPTLVAYQGRQGIYAVADPPPAPKPVAAPATTLPGAAAGGLAATAVAPVGPPPIAAGNNLMVVMTVMGQNAQQIYRNQQAVKRELATAAGVAPTQVLFYNQTANQDPRTGVTALSLSMNIECGSEVLCAEAGQTLQNSSTVTRVSDSLARSGISMLDGTFQVFGVNSFGRYRGNETLYENQQLFAARPATNINYNETISRFGQPAATTTTGALPGAMPGMPLGNFSIPGFEATPGVAGVQPGFNLSDFQVPTQSLLPPGAVPLTTNVTTVEERPRNSASSSIMDVSILLSVLVAALALM